MSKPPTYGSSLHYSGLMGDQYLSWQDSQGKISGVVNARKFKKYNFSNLTILDFGAGTGNLLFNLRAERKIAVEVNLAAHPKILSKGLESAQSLEEIPSSSVDVVLSHHALEHVPYPIAALTEMHRILKPGGQLILWVPIDDWRSQKNYDPTDINHHLNTWTPQLIGNSLSEANFLVNESSIKIVTHAWFPGFQRFYKLPGFDFACVLFSLLRHRRQLSIEVSKADY
jgi:ubiquinone/menaquinone biosynthesis C-methylase UbiE